MIISDNEKNQENIEKGKGKKSIINNTSCKGHNVSPRHFYLRFCKEPSKFRQTDVSNEERTHDYAHGSSV